MDQHKGRIWYQRALFYGSKGDERNARKADAIARYFDPNLPPLPRFHNHTLLRRLERLCLIAALLLCGWLAYHLFIHSASPAGDGFPWWSRQLRVQPASAVDSHPPASADHDAHADRAADGPEGSPMTMTHPEQYDRDAPRESEPVPRSMEPAPESAASNSAVVNPDSGHSQPIVRHPGGYPHIPPSSVSEALRPLLLLRTALYCYTKDRGGFPASLDLLVREGYIDAIPAEVISNRAQVVSSHTEEGGWFYSPPPSLSQQGLAAQIEAAMQVNSPGAFSFPFAPLCLQVDCSLRRLTLLQGSLPLKSWGIAVGAASTPTPAGSFRIVDKQILTDDGGNPYGSRWMRLGEAFPATGSAGEGLAGRGIGLHGTHRPELLGEAITNGCIRMANADLEDLYEWIPNGIAVTIH